MPLSKIDSDSLSAPLTVPAGSAAAPTITTTGDTNTGIFFPAADTIAFAEGGAEAMRIDSAGNVGIGTSSPYKRLNATKASSTAYSASDFDIDSLALQVANTTNDKSTGIYFAVGSNGEAAISAVETSDGETALTFGTRGSGSRPERARIDSSGNVGIGTSSPNSKLTVDGGQTRILSSTAFASNPLDNSSWSGAITVNTNDGAGDLSGIGMYVNSSYGAACGIFAKQTSSTTAALTFFTGSGVGASNTERMRIDSSGNLLVGVTSPSVTSSFQVKRSGGNPVTVHNNGGTSGYFNQILFLNNAGTADIGYINRVNDSSVQYVTSSDYRLKNTVSPMTGALAKVALLKPVTYKWNADGSDSQGFIAHELAEVVPDCVSGEKDAIKEQQYEVTPAVKDEEGNTVTEAVMGTRTVPSYQGIDTSFLVATLTAAIQELKAIVDGQAVLIAAQGAEIAALKGTP